MDLLLVFIGGGLGSILRRTLGLLIPTGYLPWPVIIANITGCFLIGMIWVFAQFFEWDQRVALLVITGFLGGFTTFSSYMLDSVKLFTQGAYTQGILNLLFTNIVALLMIAAGILLGQAIIKFL